MNEHINSKAKYYYDLDVAVHIKKFNGYFHNGKIIELSNDFLILEDEKDGLMPIFFIEIMEIEKREERR